MAANNPAAAFKDNFKFIFKALVTWNFSTLTGVKTLNQIIV